MATFFNEQSAKGFVLNQMMCIGHSFSLRQAVGITDTGVKAGAAQLDSMVRLATKALDDGACGISLGLDYAPGTSLAEIDAMAQLAADYGRILSVHTRLFTQNDLYSLYEMLAAIKRTGGRILFSHFVYQYSGFGTMEPAINVLRAARGNGLDVWCDTGMYTDWATYINTSTFDEQTIKDNSLRFGDMVVATGKYVGQRLNRDLYDLLRRKYPDEAVICFSGCPAEIFAAMREPYAMMSTDAGAYAPGEGHPQIAGSFPRYFRKMVREQAILPLEEAVYKATLLPAQTYQIPHKGILRAGYDADITVFNLAQIHDNAVMPDKGEPDTPPSGIPYVMVNGVFAVADGVYQNTRSGKVIRY
ncbi:MAG: amidohydrolase family protein [Ruthenibacterium sp.]